MNPFLIAAIACVVEFIGIAAVVRFLSDSDVIPWLDELAEEAATTPYASARALTLYGVLIFGPVAWTLYIYHASGLAKRRRERDRLQHPERYAPIRHTPPWI